MTCEQTNASGRGGQKEEHGSTKGTAATTSHCPFFFPASLSAAASSSHGRQRPHQLRNVYATDEKEEEERERRRGQPCGLSSSPVVVRKGTTYCVLEKAVSADVEFGSSAGKHHKQHPPLRRFQKASNSPVQSEFQRE